MRNYPNFQDHSAAIDSSGNIYSIGDSSNYLIILKHDPSGRLLWKRRLNYARSSGNLLVATDKNMNLLVSFSILSHNITLVKYDSSGNNIWNRTLV